jgi:hypothetical protein
MTVLTPGPSDPKVDVSGKLFIFNRLTQNRQVRMVAMTRYMIENMSVALRLS